MNLEDKKSFEFSNAPWAIVIAGLIISGALIMTTPKFSGESKVSSDNIRFDQVVPAQLEIPVQWGNMGKKLVETGVIDEEKFVALYMNRGISNSDYEKFLNTQEGNILITRDNAGTLLNVFWALGLANKSNILENGPMSDMRYGGADRFASTGGWTLVRGNAMSHYSKHEFIPLTKEQDALVAEVAKNIYRPCCDNSTFFPDCNHGMAMLGLLQLMASQGANEELMYKTALIVNTYWFPSVYVDIAQYLDSKGLRWADVPAKEILGANFSSSSGYRRVSMEIEKLNRIETGGSGGSCGV